MVRNEIIDMHKMFNDRAEREGAECYFSKEYVAVWEAFRDNPTAVNAHLFLKMAPTLLEYFVKCCPGNDFYEINNELKRRGL